MANNDILGQLSDLDPTLTDIPTPAQLHKVYGVYLSEYINKPFKIDGCQIVLNRKKVKDSKKYDKILLGKQDAFCHIVTRGIGNSNKRQFKSERANKIHWIRIIIENKDDSCIKYFEGASDDYKWSRFYWYKDKDYIVILREISVEILLITGYCVDASEFQKFNKQWNNYNAAEKKAKKNLPRR